MHKADSMIVGFRENVCFKLSSFSMFSSKSSIIFTTLLFRVPNKDFTVEDVKNFVGKPF